MVSLKERNDSWQNLIAGLGSHRDKSSYSHLAPNNQLSYEYLEELYHNDDIAARIIDTVPYESFRQGFGIKIDGEDFSHEEYNLLNTLREAHIYSRLYGAGFIYMGIDDGLEQHQPLRIKNIKNFRFLNVLSPQELRIAHSYRDPAHPKFSKPELYELAHNKIHESRIIAIFALKTFRKNNFPASILQRIYPVLQQFNTAWQAVSHLMTDAAQGVFKLKGLHSSMSSNRGEELLKRMELVDMSRSVSRSILLDAEDEDFRRDAYSFGGIPEILEKMMLRLASTAKMPVSLLMGQAPAGLNATGDSDIRFFYDQIKSEQEALKPHIARLIEIITKGQSKNIQIEFPALWQMTDKEQAELKRMQAETDRIYLQEGVLLPEEIALMRFPELDNSKERRELLDDQENT